MALPIEKGSNSSPRRVFVTLTDANYLPRAITMYRSLQHHHGNFDLWVLCFDQLSFEILQEWQLQAIFPVAPSDFENEELLAQRPLQNPFEYYWSYKPHAVLRTLDITNADIVTYMDCDFLFFSSPEPIFDELGAGDLLIQPNNFSSLYGRHVVTDGYYCSCYFSCANSERSRVALRRWHKQNSDWCFAKVDLANNRFADQKYLDDWPTQFPNIRENSVVGANIAPWNVQKYAISERGGQIFANNAPLIYYHYHSFRMRLDDMQFQVTGDRNHWYELSQAVLRLIYDPYVAAMKESIRDLKRFERFNEYVSVNPAGLVARA